MLVKNRSSLFALGAAGNCAFAVRSAGPLVSSAVRASASRPPPTAARNMADTEESIYNLIPRPQEIVERPPRYKSQHPGDVAPKGFGCGSLRATATMGRSLGQYREEPTTFLKKHSKEPLLPAPGPPTQPKHKLKAAVPSKEEHPTMGLVTTKNFVATNALEVMLSSSKKAAAARGADEFRWTQKPDFGKAPAYLRRNQQAVAAEREALEAFTRLREQPTDQQAAAVMSEEERRQLLRHLKDKWAALNASYQKIGFVLDIESKVKRREAMEASLAEIERDIKTLERGDAVLVVHDQ